MVRGYMYAAGYAVGRPRGAAGVRPGVEQLPPPAGGGAGGERSSMVYLTKSQQAQRALWLALPNAKSARRVEVSVSHFRSLSLTFSHLICFVVALRFRGERRSRCN